MEAGPTCREHGKVIEIHCEQCKTFMCIECLAAHAKKECEHPTSILGYAKSKLLPKYKEKSENTEEEAKAIYETINEFLTSLKITKNEFIKLKVKLEGILKAIEKSLEFFEISERDLATAKDLIKSNMANQYEELKRAVESENISYIMAKLDQPCASYVNDGERQLVEALRKATDELMAMEKLNSFKDLLDEFNAKNRLCENSNGPDVKMSTYMGIAVR